MTGIGGMLCMVVIAAVLAEVAATDYCNTEHCPPETHTMCKYKCDEPAAACGKVLKAGFTNDDKNVTVMRLNELRQEIASGKLHSLPPAAFMPNLVWDYELAYIAQRWAYQCVYDVDECFNVDRFNVGQNVVGLISTQDDIKLEELIQEWFDDVEPFNPRGTPEYTRKNSDEVGSYNQLVWASTTKLGCGCIKFRTDDVWISYFLICNSGSDVN